MTRLDDSSPTPAEDHSQIGASVHRAIVVGFGPVGRLVDERLTAQGCAVTIVEMNLSTIQAQLGLERRCTYGDARDAETLRRAGVERAHALIVAVPDEDAAVEIVRVARGLRPDLYIAARTNFVSRGIKAKAAGANDVVIEEIVTAEAMAGLVSRQWCPIDPQGDGGQRDR
ncbi:MAG: NAD(P)-binding protein [Planctomycetota bacterium]